MIARNQVLMNDILKLTNRPKLKDQQAHGMTRQKTLLSEHKQCESTIALASEWAEGILPFIKMLPSVGDFDMAEYRTRFNEIIRLIELRKNKKYENSYKNLLEFFWEDEEFETGTTWQVGIAERNSRYFLKGDLVLILLSNGTDRQPIWSVSSKGKKLTGYFVDTTRCGEQFDIKYIVFPDELVGQQLTDPEPLAFMQRLRAGHVPQPGRHE